MRRELLLGCGTRRVKLVGQEGHHQWEGLVTLDNNADLKPDVLHDLNVRPLPFDKDSFDEIHAYEVLEHIGRQGDYSGFFAEFMEYWHILKPNGLLVATVPRWDRIWAWSDPGHTRVITDGTLTFLRQPEYTKPDRGPMTDYRHIYTGDFEPVHVNYTDLHFEFALQAVKPARIEESR